MSTYDVSWYGAQDAWLPTELLPDEPQQLALYWMDTVAYNQHRLKALIDENNVDEQYALSFDIGRSVNRFTRWLRDRSANEILDQGAYAALCVRLGTVPEVLHDTFANRAIACRRIAMQIKRHRTGRRLTKSDLIGVTEAAIFEAALRCCPHDVDLCEVFCSGRLDLLSEPIREQLAVSIAGMVNEGFDAIDQKVFGGVVPYCPLVIQQLCSVWARIGTEWIVARTAIHRLSPWTNG